MVHHVQVSHSSSSSAHASTSHSSSTNSSSASSSNSTHQTGKHVTKASKTSFTEVCDMVKSFVTKEFKKGYNKGSLEGFSKGNSTGYATGIHDREKICNRLYQGLQTWKFCGTCQRNRFWLCLRKFHKLDQRQSHGLDHWI